MSTIFDEFHTKILIFKYTSNKVERYFSLLPLCVNYFSIHYLPRTRLNVVHSSYPFPGIFCFQLLRDSLCLFHLPYQPFKTFLSLFFYVNQITIQSAVHKQIQIYIPAIFLQYHKCLCPHTPTNLGSSSSGKVRQGIK